MAATSSGDTTRLQMLSSMYETGRLVLNGGDDVRVAVAGGGDGDARGEVEEEVAVHVLNHRPAAAGDDKRVDPCVGGRHELLVALEQLLRLGAGQLRLDLRDV